MTECVWIAGETLATSACREMVSDKTVSVLGATTRTRVLAFILDTIQIECTIVIRCAFGTATGIRISIVFGQALTRADSITFNAFGI